jgi:guanine deaminase
VSGIKASSEEVVMDFKERLVELAKANVVAGGRPFSCLIVKDGVVLAEGVNRVAQTHDPTAHAEISAIREVTAKLHAEHLIGCTFYILAHPCPMRLPAMYYCSPDRVVFLVTRDEYASFYQDDRKYITYDEFTGKN